MTIEEHLYNNERPKELTQPRLTVSITDSLWRFDKPGNFFIATANNCQFMIIYPSHGYTALVADEICKTYQAILACWSSLGT